MRPEASRTYIHGYSGREAERLVDQAEALTRLLHHDTRYPAGSRVLEAGCGVGAQTVILARQSPAAEITSVDLSAPSLALAGERVKTAGAGNVTFLQADICTLPFRDGSFDHAFICFVLEHLPDPALALASLHRVLRPGGSITVIEGDHGSAFFHPDSGPARKAIACLVAIQREMGGNALIGRSLSPLLTAAGFGEVAVSPRTVYADSSLPELVEGFTRQTFTAMVEGVRDAALERGMVSRAGWEEGIRDLHRTAGPGGTFTYTFFKAVGVKPLTRSRGRASTRRPGSG